jgi:hypothetical protein
VWTVFLFEVNGQYNNLLFLSLENSINKNVTMQPTSSEFQMES